MPGDEKRQLAFRVFGKRKIPAEIEEANIGDDIAAVIAGDAVNVADGSYDRYLEFPQYVHFLTRQVRDKLIDRALKGALKDLKRQDRYGFISEEERGGLKVCDLVLAAATGILEAAGPDRAPEFFDQIQHMVDEQPDLDRQSRCLGAVV